MKMKPYSVSETLPAKLPENRGAIAEHKAAAGYGDANGYSDSFNVNGSQAPPPELPPTYFQLLLRKVGKRRKLFVVWLALTAFVAGAVVKQYGKPTWRAEGSLYYSPSFSYSFKRLYTPPNIQTVLAMIKSPEILEKLRAEKHLDTSVDALQSKMSVSVLRQSDLITVALDWPDREQAPELTNRILELALEKYDQQRHKMATQAIGDLNESLRKTKEELQTTKNKLNESLGNKDIYDLQTAKSIVQNEVAMFQKQISEAETEQSLLEIQIKEMDERIKLLSQESKTDNGPPSEAEINILSQMKDTRERQFKRQQEVEQAKAQLKAKEDEFNQNIGLYRKGYIPKQEWSKLEADIASLKVLTAGTKEVNEMEKKLKELESKILDAKRGAGALPFQQTRLDKLNKEVMLKVMPTKIENLKAHLVERRKHEEYLQSVEKVAAPIQQDIQSLKQRLDSLTIQAQEHEGVEKNKSELTIYSAAAISSSPVATNYFKLVVAVLGVSLLVFAGFIAVWDMPGESLPYAEPVPPLGAPAKHEELETRSRRAFAALKPKEHGSIGANRTPEMTNEHLRALAERIAQNATERGSIVLFASAVRGLHIESLVGDLGCYYSQLSGKVLVFDARTASDPKVLPSWAGPAAVNVGEHVEDYLEGRSEKSEGCFAPTLISSIDYSRGDLCRHMAGVMAMYRFRRLVHDMKERYSLIMMITPERYHGGEGDIFGTLAEGIVVVVTDNADPEEVETYLETLRASETPVYGAVTVPS